MSIRFRLFLGSLVLVSLTVILGAYLSYQLNKVSQNTMQSIEKPLQAVNISRTAWDEFRVLKTYVSNVLLRTQAESNAAIKNNFLLKYARYDTQLKLLSNYSQSDKIETLLINIIEYSEEWKSKQLKIVAGENLLLLPSTHSLLLVEHKLETALNVVIKTAISDAIKQQSEIKSNSSVAIKLAIALVIITALVALLLARSFSSALIKPLTNMLNFMNKLTLESADLSKRINEKSSITEYDELEKIFNRMLDKIENNQHTIEESLTAANTANKTKSSFLANMSHELRTPLTAIIGYSELIEEYSLEKNYPECVADSSKINTAGIHLLCLVNNLLDLSKIEAGKMEVVANTFKVNALLQVVIENTISLIKKNNNQLTINVKPDIGEINSDQTMLLQIMINLVSNAAKFTANGIIKIDCMQTRIMGKEWIKINVMDNGIGMSETQLNRVFQEFVQADSTTTKLYGGTGLGLTITKKYCELLGGHLSVSSKINGGTNFCAEIPVVYTDNSSVRHEDVEKIVHLKVSGGN